VKLGTGPAPTRPRRARGGAAQHSSARAAPGERTDVYVEGGIAQMKDNNLTVVTQMAVPAEEINAETAKPSCRSNRASRHR
jgi:F0F1-type ATP synthase epsilon subunit